MKNVVFELFDLLQGELNVEEDRHLGKVVYVFTSYEDLLVSILYYPGNKELILRQDFPSDFNSYIPMDEENVKTYLGEWIEDRFKTKVPFKGIKYISFL